MWSSGSQLWGHVLDISGCSYTGIKLRVWSLFGCFGLLYELGLDFVLFLQNQADYFKGLVCRNGCINMKRFFFCCFKEEELESHEEGDQKTSNLESELTMSEKLNIVKEMIRKSVEQSKNNRVVKKHRVEVVVGVEDIPVYEDVNGKLRTKNQSRQVVFTE